jgi:putative Mg2+ transporter-C (MgtC) family protein
VPADAAAVSLTGEWLTPALRLGAAALAGGLIGWEREKPGRPAGLRTHMLVSLGSAIIVMIFAGHSLDAASRVAQGIATGVGFLCAGDILHHVREGEERVTGLTSAASLWVTSALGMAAATGRWSLTVIGAVFTFATLTILHSLEARHTSRQAHDGGKREGAKRDDGGR